MQIARELKMPVEDMSAIGAPDLPDLTRLQGLYPLNCGCLYVQVANSKYVTNSAGTFDNKCPHQLSGNMCGDVLMVLEFVETFKECLRIGE